MLRLAELEDFQTFRLSFCTIGAAEKLTKRWTNVKVVQTEGPGQKISYRPGQFYASLYYYCDEDDKDCSNQILLLIDIVETKYLQKEFH